MVDIVDTATRSRMMSGIRGKNTKPEIAIRRYLHAQGFRFRLHKKELPGRPDLVLPKYQLAVFIHGCFWHRHAGCFYATSPATRSDFWNAKLTANAVRDKKNVSELISAGWRVMTIWECGIKHLGDHLHEVIEHITSSEKIGEWPVDAPRKRQYTYC